MHGLHDSMHDNTSPYSLAERRKRSVVNDEENAVEDSYLSDTDSQWNSLDEQDFFQRNVRQLIPSPRVGRSATKLNDALIAGFGSDYDLNDPIDVQLRAAFIPRLGKRANNNNVYGSDQWLRDLRAAAFTPRIGRAAFTPRIGKKASFVPRIGRSVAQNREHTHLM